MRVVKKNITGDVPTADTLIRGFTGEHHPCFLGSDFMKRLLSVILASLIIASALLTGCSEGSNEYKDPTEGIELAKTDDKYRNYYQIWIGSFCDSNGDETGDIPGIISKLDYLNDGDPTTDTDLGITGIWLSPMMPSISYHKYDVMDYYDIDEEFGTMADFEKLIAECDKRGIKVILDLVLNHCSSRHPWFRQACEEVQKGKYDGYAKYFEILTPDNPITCANRSDATTGVAFEGNFSFEMPEWNLSSEATREEFEKIAKFWLEKGVAGFRLDAVKYFTNEHTDGKEFMKWFYDTAKKYNEDVYMVGENWVGPAEIYEMYTSGIDSQFAFKLGTASGDIISAVASGVLGESYAAQVKKYQENILKRNENAINAVFLTNHDMVRAANALVTENNIKMAAALYLTLPGNTFTYYGEETGTNAPYADNDANYRTAMIWDSDNLPAIFVNGVGDPEDTKFHGVSQQEKDDYSILNFYKRAFKIRNQNPELARGIITQTVKFDDPSVAAYITEYNGTKLLVVHNTSERDAKQLTITDEILKNAKLRGDLTAQRPKQDKDGNDIVEHVMFSGGVLNLPPQSSAVFKAE